jgi:hypothetical protein
MFCHQFWRLAPNPCCDIFAALVRRKNAVFCVCGNAWSAAQRLEKEFVLRTGRMKIRPLFFLLAAALARDSAAWAIQC